MDGFFCMRVGLKLPQFSRRAWPLWSVRAVCLASGHPGLFQMAYYSVPLIRSRCVHSIDHHHNSAGMFIQSLQRQNKISQKSVMHPCTCTNLHLRNSVLLQGITIRNFKTDSKQDCSSKEAAGISLWKRALFVATVGGLMWYCFWSVNRQKDIDEEKVRYDEFKKAQIGGDWRLTDQHGKLRSSTEFRGQWLLMYFGFTHCPDICPEELEKLIRIVKTFDADPKLPKMLPIFISLDPDRDTPAVIREYLADLKYPRMLGFTGTEEEIAEVAKRFRAYFKKGPPDADNDYIVDHTIIIYLVSPKGEFVNYYDRSRTAERIVASVTEHIDKYNSLEKGVSQ